MTDIEIIEGALRAMPEQIMDHAENFDVVEGILCMVVSLARNDSYKAVSTDLAIEKRINHDINLGLKAAYEERDALRIALDVFEADKRDLQDAHRRIEELEAQLADITVDRDALKADWLYMSDALDHLPADTSRLVLTEYGRLKHNAEVTK